MDSTDRTPAIPGRLLAEHLRIQYDTLRFAWRTMLPPKDPDAYAPQYDYDVVTAFLNADAHGFTTPPTAYDLMSGRLKLLTLHEVLALIPRVTRRKLTEGWVPRGKVRALKIGGQYRFEEASVLRVVSLPDRLTTAEVGHILGVHQWLTLRRQLIEPGRLEVVQDPTLGKRVAVSRHSLLEVLGGPEGLLPKSIDPEDWIDDREACSAPLMQTSEAMRFIGEGIHHIKRLAADGTLRFVWSPMRKERHFCPESLLAYVERFPLTNVQIAHLYGVTNSAVGLWRQAGLMDCTLHSHTGTERQLYRACIIEMLRHHLSPGILPAKWFTSRMGTTLELMPSGEAASVLGMTRAELATAAQKGEEIGGIRTPTGASWSFSRQRIERLERRRRRAAAQE